jgi:hypothetical protein
VDILAASTDAFNPYHYGNNNPVMFNDPTGARPSPVPKYGEAPTPGEMANMEKLWGMMNGGGRNCGV